MTKLELIKNIVFITGAAYAEASIRDAVDTYSSALIAAKPIVGCSASNISQSQTEYKIENYFDDDDDSECDDDDAYEDYMEKNIEETLRNCSCNAYQLGDNGQLYKVADCCC